MFDLKPDAPGGVGGEFKPIATSAPGVEVCELLPLTARWMHKAADRAQRVSQRRLPQEPADVHRLRRQPARRGVSRQRPAEHGLGLRVPGARPAARSCRPTPICPARWAGARCARRPGRTAGFWAAATIRSAPSARPTSTIRPTTSGSRRSCAASRGWRDTELPDGITLDRLDGRRRLVEQFDDAVPRGSSRGATWATFRASSGWPSRCSPRPRSARRSTSAAKTPARATATAARCSARRRCWPGGWSSGACGSST